MAFIPIVDGSCYKGKLNMFGSAYDYHLRFYDVCPGKFSFEHKMLMGNSVADQKTGSGTFEMTDPTKISIHYSDPETEFNGVLNLDTKIFTGDARQISGLYLASLGTFELHLS